MPSRTFTLSLVCGCLFVLDALCVGVPAQGENAAAPTTTQRSSEPNREEPMFQGARQLSQLGKYDEAVETLRQLAVSHPELKGLDHEFGVTYYKKSDFINAIAHLKKAREENPNDEEAVQLLGLSYYLAGHPADAIAPLEKVQTWFPSANVDAAYILGLCYMQTKDYPRARKAFAGMFGVPDDSAAGYLFAARMLLRQDFS